MEHDDYISEGYAHSDNEEAGGLLGKWELQSLLGIRNPLNDGYGRKRKRRGGSLGVTIDKAKELYITAEKAKVGEMINCPCCNHSFEKTSYQQKFHRTKCKDVYWNSVDPIRRERAKLYKK